MMASFKLFYVCFLTLPIVFAAEKTLDELADLIIADREPLKEAFGKAGDITKVKNCVDATTGTVETHCGKLFGILNAIKGAPSKTARDTFFEDQEITTGSNLLVKIKTDFDVSADSSGNPLSADQIRNKAKSFISALKIFWPDEQNMENLAKCISDNKSNLKPLLESETEKLNDFKSNLEKCVPKSSLPESPQLRQRDVLATFLEQVIRTEKAVIASLTGTDKTKKQDDFEKFFEFDKTIQTDKNLDTEIVKLFPKTKTHTDVIGSDQTKPVVKEKSKSLVHALKVLVGLSCDGCFNWGSGGMIAAYIILAVLLLAIVVFLVMKKKSKKGKKTGENDPIANK